MTSEPRLDAWNPADRKWSTRPAHVDWCDLCGVAREIDPDSHDTTGMFVCVACIEHELQGAVHE